MKQSVEDNVEIKCNQNTANSNKKIIKTKESSETTDQIYLLNEENSEDDLANVHINNINSNLTNGSNDHTNEENNSSPSIASKTCKLKGEPLHNVEGHVNSVHYFNNVRDQNTDEIKLVRNLVDEVLENLETTLNLKDQSSQEDISILSYESELQMPEIMRLIQKDLSEPYSIYTYRYFIHNWPKLCFLARHEGKCIGAIVCKLDLHRNVVKRGYIAMLAVDEKYRKRKIGSSLVRKAIQAMINDNADEVVLETEITNKPALKLYENLGFVRDKRLFRYYLNGVDALRLKLWLR